MRERIYKLDEIDAVARELLASEVQPNAQHATVWGLQGDLGAGKTTLVQAIARVLGVGETVASPTFILQKRYPLAGQRFASLIHIDAYRLESAAELKPLRLEETLSDPENLVLFEWPERADAALPPHIKLLKLSVIDESTRRIVYGS